MPDLVTMLMVEPRKLEYCTSNGAVSSDRLLDSVDRDRRTLRRVAVVVEPEVVALTHAVDGQAVVAVVDASHFQRVGVGRIDPGFRVDAAACPSGRALICRRRGDRLGREVRTHAERGGPLRLRGDLDLGELRGLEHRQRHARAAADLGVDVLDRGGLVARGRRRDGVRPTDAQTGGVELARRRWSLQKPSCPRERARPRLPPPRRGCHLHRRPRR